VYCGAMFLAVSAEAIGLYFLIPLATSFSGLIFSLVFLARSLCCPFGIERGCEGFHTGKLLMPNGVGGLTFFSSVLSTLLLCLGSIF